MRCPGAYVRSAMRSDDRVPDEPEALEHAEQLTMSEGLASRSEARLLRRRLQQGIGGMSLQKASLFIVADAVDHTMHARQRAGAIDRVERNVNARILARRRAALNRSRDGSERRRLGGGRQRVALPPDPPPNALQLATLGSSLNHTGWDVPAQGVTKAWACWPGTLTSK